MPRPQEFATPPQGAGKPRLMRAPPPLTATPPPLVTPPQNPVSSEPDPAPNDATHDATHDAKPADQDRPQTVTDTKETAPDAPQDGTEDGAKDNAQNRPRRNKNANRKTPQKRPAPKVVEVAPIATPARMHRRHWALLFSFLILVGLPLAGSAWYLWSRAADQYASTVGFTVRQEQGPGATDLLTGFASQLGGGGGSSDTDILYEFIQSQSLVAQMDAKFDLRGLYSAPYRTDPVFALSPEASLEDLIEYWQRIVRISYDETARLLELRVLAFEPQVARDIGLEILTSSQLLINELNAQVRTDTLRYAEGDLNAAQDRLKAARTNLIRFRTRTQLVDPETDLAGRMGVVNTLQGQLAEALIEADLLAQSTNQNDPRVVQARRRIEVIRKRIAEERENVARGEDDGADYPTLLSEYESLVADREFAEQSYLAALAALDAARADASRQSRYLATYVAPTLPETAEFPQRWTLFGLIALFLLLSWSILALIYYSVRDSR